MSRTVRICTISMNSLVYAATGACKEEILREAEAKIALGALDRPDLYLLPEVFLLNGTPEAWFNPANVDEVGNETYQRLGQAARDNHAYVAAPLLTREDGLLYNSTVIFDREGEPVYTYHKTYLTQSERGERGITPGSKDQRCFDCEFGRIGVAICYDLKFQPLLKHYYDQGMELLLFPSYFPGGLRLRSWAYLYMFHAVSSHAQGYESVFVNSLGCEVARADMFTQALTHEFELDSVVLPYLSNREATLAAKARYGPAVETEVSRPEGDMILRYRGTETTIKKIMSEFAMVTRAEEFNNEHLV